MSPLQPLSSPFGVTSLHSQEQSACGRFTVSSLVITKCGTSIYYSLHKRINFVKYIINYIRLYLLNPIVLSCFCSICCSMRYLVAHLINKYLFINSIVSTFTIYYSIHLDIIFMHPIIQSINCINPMKATAGTFLSPPFPILILTLLALSKF